MKPKNLISVFIGDSVVNEKMHTTGDRELRRFISLKEREIENVRSFCKIMTEEGCKIKHFDGFFVGYKIPQIGKEIDLLRFGSDFILNIEMKSELEESKKEDKILTQMRKNYYYVISRNNLWSYFSHHAKRNTSTRENLR